MPSKNNPPHKLAYVFSLLWIYLAYRCLSGWIQAAQGQPERSLCGRWTSAGQVLDCRADGTVNDSRLVTWQGSRLIFSCRELESICSQKPDDSRWDIGLARACGIIRRMDQDSLDGPHFNHRQVGSAIEATVKWHGEKEFEIDGTRFTKAGD